MKNENKYAIVRRVYQNNWRPVMILLMPQLDVPKQCPVRNLHYPIKSKNNNNNEIFLQCFIGRELTYGENFCKVEPLKEISTVTQREMTSNSDDELVEAVDNLIDAMTMPEE